MLQQVTDAHVEGGHLREQYGQGLKFIFCLEEADVSLFTWSTTLAVPNTVEKGMALSAF